MNQPDLPSPPDSPTPPDAPRAAGVHRAPPVDERPRSTLGIWALFLSVVLGLLSAMLGFVWILLLPAVLLALYGVTSIRPEVAKGQGMAIVALMVALGAGSCSYLAAGIFRDMSTAYARGVLAALAGSEDRRLDGWLDEKAREEGLAETLRARFEAVVAEVGPYQREIVESSVLGGATGVISPPSVGDVEALGGDGDGPPLGLEQGALWARARFERAVLLVELTFGRDREGLTSAAADLKSDKALGALTNVRFWRPRDASAD